MKITALTITAAGVALAAAAALLPSLPASAAENVPEGDWGIKASIDAVGVGLRFTDWQAQSDAGYQPGDVNAGGETRFFVTSNGYGHGVSADATARIYDGSDGSTPTGYYVKISVSDRSRARQTSECTVTVGDPNPGGPRRPCRRTRAT